MPKPLAICIEDVDAPDTPDAPRYVRCVALPGRQPGLRVSAAGHILWQSDAGAACELWVSADERLILYRPEGCPPVALHRAGRSLDVPHGKPVVVIDQDEVDVGPRRLRLHIHGDAPAVTAPAPLPPRPGRPRSRLARAAVTAALVGAAATTGACLEVRLTPPEPIEPTKTPEPTIDVRDFPPLVAPTEPATPTIEVREFPPTATAPLAANSVGWAIAGEWSVSQAYDVAGEQAWITGTLEIVGGAYTFTPAQAATGPSTSGALDFLFEHPVGQVMIEYGDAVSDYTRLDTLAPGSVLAQCTFYADSAVVGELIIKKVDAETLQFTDPASVTGLWSITKPIKGGE